jgi:hypothetical protein
MGGWFQEVSPWDLGRLPELWAATFGEHPRVVVPLVGVGFEAAVGVLLPAAVVTTRAARR